jgi:hypothetical protein
MKLEDQVVSLDLAKRLKELGVEQKSLFWWVNGHGKIELHDRRTDDGSVSAFTVAELGEILPPFVKTERDGYVNFRQRKTDNGLYLCSGYPGEELVIEFGDGTNEADARAKMLIYLIENKLILANQSV